MFQGKLEITTDSKRHGVPEIFCCITKIPFKLIFNGNTKPHDVSGTSIISNNMMFKGTLMAILWEWC